MKIIDSHLHLFALEEGEYNWLKPGNPPFWSDKPAIAKSFFELDLTLDAPLLQAGFVHIEAGFDNDMPWREIDWLSANCTSPFSAVAGFDLLAANGLKQVDALLKRQPVTGVRHILDDEAASILAQPLTATSFDLLSQAKLSFDAQLSLLDIPGVKALNKAVAQFPELTFIINHGGFPLSSPEQGSLWQDSVKLLARHENVAIKLSGWEMHERQWRGKDIAGYVEQTLNWFGTERVMLGSNFPLCLWRCSYQQYWQDIIALVPERSLRAVAGNNAGHWYRVAAG